MHFLHSGKIAGLDEEFIFTTLYAATKYQTVPLVNACVKFVDDTISVENACRYYHKAKGFDNDSLTARCIGFIRNSPVPVLKSKGFLELPSLTMVLTFVDEITVCGIEVFVGS